ncbi:MAG: hypothetical protein J6J26_01145 [Bacteroides sp.]|nr:hypothetical protein [Bacteroides sp.]
MRIQYITLLFTFLMCLPLSAQKKGKYTKEEFRAKKQAYMTEKAGLTEEEAENFFPLYFELQNKKKESNKAIWKKASKGMKQETPESEYKEIIDDFFESQQQNLDMEKEYIEKYRKVLSDKKIYMIYWAEIKFNRNMLKILQEMEEK